MSGYQNINLLKSFLEALFEAFQKFLSYLVASGNNFNFDNVVNVFNTTILPPALLWSGQWTYGNRPKGRSEFIQDCSYLFRLDGFAGIVFQRQVDRILSHTARLGSGMRILLAFSFLNGIRLRFRVFSCSSRTP